MPCSSNNKRAPRPSHRQSIPRSFPLLRLAPRRLLRPSQHPFRSLLPRLQPRRRRPLLPLPRPLLLIPQPRRLLLPRLPSHLPPLPPHLPRQRRPRRRVERSLRKTAPRTRTVRRMVRRTLRRTLQRIRHQPQPRRSRLAIASVTRRPSVSALRRQRRRRRQRRLQPKRPLLRRRPRRKLPPRRPLLPLLTSCVLPPWPHTSSQRGRTRLLRLVATGVDRKASEAPCVASLPA